MNKYKELMELRHKVIREVNVVADKLFELRDFRQHLKLGEKERVLETKRLRMQALYPVCDKYEINEQQISEIIWGYKN